MTTLTLCWLTYDLLWSQVTTMCILYLTMCIKLALPQGARLIKDALLIDREVKRKKPSTRRDSSPRPLCHEAFALLLCYNDFSSLVYLKMSRYLLFSAKPGVSIMKILKCLQARNYAKPLNFSRWGPPTCSVVCHASRMDATPLCVSACACVCVHTNVIVGTFVSVCFDIVGTPNIVGTHCWDSCFLDSQPYEMQMEKFSAMVPTVLLCVIVCALVNFRLSQPFLGLLGS